MVDGSRPVWIGTSWKMNKTLAEAAAFIDRLSAAPIPRSVQPFVLPAHTALAAARARLPRDSPVRLGAQNAHWAAEGAWTGEISMRMAADAGATMVELGHSERREHFNETDQTIARKVAAALDHDLVPLVCVGEPTEVRDRGDAESFVADQVTAALARAAPGSVGACLIAYEPIWAIGARGRPASEVEVAPVMSAIATAVAELTGGGRACALLYGGSVSVGNAAELLRSPHTDGLFVGRAAWDIEGFLALMRVGAAHVEVNCASQNNI
ncbi:triose-phosphate isomerase [Microlunatus ginsengisoli]|uniref:Triosephosphate isomerase n=1 Tax=Microlunatus ginsengisoli TaxID=363863 RepID=A0ABP6ZFS5_9ACTN